MHKFVRVYNIITNILMLKQATLQLDYWRTQFGNTGKIGKKIK